MSLREIIEATIRGRPQQFVERCDVPAILSAIDNYGISDIDGLLTVLNDAEQKADLRAAIGTAAPPALLLFVKDRAVQLRSERADRAQNGGQNRSQSRERMICRLGCVGCGFAVGCVLPV